MNEIKRPDLAFLKSVGEGCISGQVVDWPQLKPSCRAAVEWIEHLESEEERDKEHENFLFVHRDNLALTHRVAELKAENAGLRDAIAALERAGGQG